MNEEQIRQLLQSQRRAGLRRGFRCPDENSLAAYVDGQLNENARSAFESHASNCASCLEALGFLTRSAEWEQTGQTPAYLISVARGLVTEKRAPIWRWRWALATGATACVVLAVAFVVWNSRVQETPTPTNGPFIAQNQHPTPVDAETPAVEPQRPMPTRSVTKPNLNRGETPSVRGGENEFKPILLYPREGSVVRRDDLEFRWKPGADAVSYEVRIVTADGSLKLVKETKAVALKLGDEVELRDDANYYVTVVAQTSDGRFTRSDIVKFHLAKE